jgi:hypothetical protein
VFSGLFYKNQLPDMEQETKPLSDKERLEAERRELNLLIGRGITFDVKRTIRKRKPGILGLLGGRVQEEVTESFRIHEPTLSTLDRMSALQIELSIEEEKLSSDGAFGEAWKLTKENSRRMARIVALAVMGQDYVSITQEGSRHVYRYDNKGLDELSEALYHSLTPSQLGEIIVLINALSNLADFTNSIRLMSGTRTTMPHRIEANNEG